MTPLLVSLTPCYVGFLAACGFIAMSHEPNIRQCLRQSSSYAGPATTCVLCLLPYVRIASTLDSQL